MGAHLFFLFVVLLISFHNYIQGGLVLWPLAALAVYLAAQLARQNRLRAQLDFIDQLKSCRREMRQGGTVAVDGLLLRYESEVTYYQISVGVLFVSVTIPSSYRLFTGENRPETIWYSIATLLAGWWSISGPLNTLQTLSENLRGGRKLQVARLVDSAYLRKLEEKRQIEDAQSPRLFETRLFEDSRQATRLRKTIAKRRGRA